MSHFPKYLKIKFFFLFKVPQPYRNLRLCIA